MPTRTFTINFKAVFQSAITGCKALRMELLAIEKQAIRTESALRSMAGKIVAAIRAIQAASKAAGDGLNGLAGHNAAFQALEAQLAAARKAMRDLTSAANAANAAAGRAGQGGTRGGGGGRGGGGVPGKPGFIQTAVDVKSVADMAIGMARTAANLTAGTISGQADKAREYYGTSTEKAEQFQKDMASWASLTGRVGVGKEAAQEVFSFANQTGIRVAAAGQFVDRFEGSGQLGIERGNLGGTVGSGGFTKEAQEKLKTGILGVSAQFGTRVGIDPAIAADIAAGVIQHNKITDVNQFAGQVAGLHYGADQGKGDMGTLIRASLGAGATDIPSGRLSGLPEAGAWMGTWSALVGKEGQVDEAHRQATRLLNTMGKEGGADYLRSLGVDKVPGTLDKLNLVAADVKAKGVTDVAAYLSGKGFGASEEIRSIEAILPQIGVLNARVSEAKARATRGGEVLTKNAEYQDRPLVRGEVAKAMQEANEIKEGYRQQESQNALAEAKARLTDPDQPGGNRLINRGLAESYAGKMGEFRTWLRGGGNVQAEDVLVQQEAMRAQIAEAKGVGVDLSKPTPMDLWGLDPSASKPNFASALADNMMLPPQEFQAQFAENQSLIDAKRRAAEALRNAAKAVDAMDRQDRAGGGAGGGPAVEPKRR